MEHETFWTLLCDPSHWLFELFLMLLFDGIVGALLWPWIKQKIRHHKSDDDKIATLERQVRFMKRRLRRVLRDDVHNRNHSQPKEIVDSLWGRSW